MSQKSFLDNKKITEDFPYVGGGSTHIWKIPYVSSFLFLKASLRSNLPLPDWSIDIQINFRFVRLTWKVKNFGGKL